MLTIQRVRLQGFTVWQQGEVIVPAGVTAIVGTNGSGKSSILEAVAWCLYGETLRGDNPWTETAEGNALLCEVEVDVLAHGNAFNVTRTRKGKRTTLVWSCDGVSQQYDTATKAQQDLEATLGGSLEFWRRTSIFSSSDAAHFSEATDADRKRLLEDALGLEYLDRAGAAARAVVRDATAGVVAAEAKQREAAAVLGQLRQAAERAVGQLDAAPEPPPLRAQPAPAQPPMQAEPFEPAPLPAPAREALPVELWPRSLSPQPDVTTPDADEVACVGIRADLLAELGHAEKSLRQLQKDRDAAKADAGRHAVAAQRQRDRKGEAQRRLALLQNAACPTCEQGIGDAVHARLHAEVDAAVAALEAEAVAYDSKATNAQFEADDLAEDIVGVEADIAARRVTVQALVNDLLLMQSRRAGRADAWRAECGQVNAANEATRANWRAACAQVQARNDAAESAWRAEVQAAKSAYLAARMAWRSARDAAEATAAAELSLWRAEERAHGAALATHARAVTALQYAQQAAADGATAVFAADEAMAAAQLELATAQAVAQVLGTKGVRATMLGRALVGLELCANGWLARFGTEMRLHIREYTDTKAATTREAISLTVDRPGVPERRYRSHSGGERRRLDVALLLGLAEVAGAAGGGVAGTLALDEVMDAIDDDGIDAVAAAIVELGQTRPVLVISHRKDLLQRLPGATVWRVDKGAVLAGGKAKQALDTLQA